MERADFPYMRLLIPPIMGVSHMIRERYPPFMGREAGKSPMEIPRKSQENSHITG